jgi:hypothetical protein
MKNPNTMFTTILLLLGCCALSPVAQAKPPPSEDRGNGNSAAENVDALSLGTTGSNNTAHGWFSLFSNTTGSSNTADGFQVLYSNTAGDANTAVGYQALFSNTTSSNTAIGTSALFSNTTGGTLGNIQGSDFGPNVAVGSQALESNTVASANTAVGYQALHSFTTGPVNFEQFGFCTAVGFEALANASGDGYANSGFGYEALHNNTDGAENTAVGHRALAANTTGNFNTAIGSRVLLNNASGSYNTAVGRDAGALVTTASNVICIGAAVYGADVNHSCYIGEIWGQSGGDQAVYVNSQGKLGYVVSSRRFKDEIKPVDKASEVIYGLKPVSFRYKKEIEPTRPLGFGLIAEDVEKVSADLVTRGSDGKASSVRYEAVNAMLLNEFLKEHRRNEEQQATIERLQKQIEALTAGLQKVSAQLEPGSMRNWIAVNTSKQSNLNKK